MNQETVTPDAALLRGEFVTRSDEETRALARRIGERLSGRAVFLLRGDLGAGKTVFARGLAEGLGVDPEDVTSPTFTLINVYEGRRRVYHMDLYRLEGGATFDLGVEEILEEEGAVVVVEWAERLGFMPAGATAVEIEWLDDEERRIRMRPAAG